MAADHSNSQVLPRLALRVGFVGKRNLHASAGAALKGRVSEVLELIEQRVAELLAEPEFQGIYRQTATGEAKSAAAHLILISSLAKGADLIASEAALERGWKLHVVLPFGADLFRKANSGDAAFQQNFDTFLGNAESRFVMDLPQFEPGQEEKAKNEAYGAAGTLIVAYSDVMLAIWDGIDTGLKGGTSDSIQKAAIAKVPVVQIATDGKSIPRLIHPEDREKGYLRELILRVLKMPEDEAGAGKIMGNPRERFLRYAEERPPGWNPAFAYRWARRVLLFGSKKRPALNTERWPGAPEPGWKLVQDYFQPPESRADGLAVSFAGWTRGTFTLNCILSAIAVSATVAPRLWNGVEILNRLEIAGAIASLLAILLYAHASWREVHPRWIEYRVLAELLYSRALLMGIGASPRLPSGIQAGYGEFSGWVKWYVDAMVRDAGLFPLTLDKGYLATYRKLLMTRQRDQARGYHARSHRDNEFIAGRIGHIGVVLFGIAIASCLFELTKFAGMGDSLRFETWKTSVTSLAVLATIWGAALAVFAFQAEFSKLAQVSGILKGQLERLMSDADMIESGAELRTCASNTAEVMMQEHEDWYLFYSLKELERPV